MRASVVVVEKVIREAGVAMAAGGIAASVSPFTGEGLDKTFGFAVGLRTVGPGKPVFDAECMASVGESV